MSRRSLRSDVYIKNCTHTSLNNVMSEFDIFRSWGGLGVFWRCLVVLVEVMLGLQRHLAGSWSRLGAQQLFWRAYYPRGDKRSKKVPPAYGLFVFCTKSMHSGQWPPRPRKILTMWRPWYWDPRKTTHSTKKSHKNSRFSQKSEIWPTSGIFNRIRDFRREPKFSSLFTICPFEMCWTAVCRA